MADLGHEVGEDAKLVTNDLDTVLEQRSTVGGNHRVIEFDGGLHDTGSCLCMKSFDVDAECLHVVEDAVEVLVVLASAEKTVAKHARRVRLDLKVSLLYCTVVAHEIVPLKLRATEGTCIQLRL